MAYVPINTASYVASYAGAIAGMAVPGWITDPNSADYADVTIIAGAFAQAFDIAWNNAAQLNDLELACMTSVVQSDFNGRGPGPFASATFKDPTNWNVAARACVALILECDIFFASQGITPGTGGSATININQVVFVDGVLGTAAGPGSIGGALAFATLQQAADYAADTLLLQEVWIQCAPGQYQDTLFVPPGITIGICAWGDKLGVDVELAGNIIFEESSNSITFKDVSCFMGEITVSNVNNDDLSISFENCDVSAEVLANILNLNLHRTKCSGDVTGTTSLTLNTDGESWASLVGYDVTLLPADFLRGFWDAGHTVYSTTLNVLGVPVFPAVGSTVFVPMSIPGNWVRQNDRAQIQAADEYVQDYICGVHSVADGSVTAWLTNLSRVSTDFSESVLLTFHHNEMISNPEPP